MSTSKIYLSRAGQTYGPITESKLRAFRESGRLFEYMWIWQSPEKGWESLHAMPPAPVEAEARELREETPAPVRTPSPGYTSTREPAPATRRPSRSIKPDRALEAVLHDFHNLVTGRIESLSETGCELSCEDAEAGPHFREKALLVLNLLDPASGQTMNVRAKLGQVSREKGHWTYQLSWEQLPELLNSV